MAGIITNRFRLLNAKTFIEKGVTSDSYYAFIGQPQEWPGGLGEAPSPEINELDEVMIWEGMQSLKRLQQPNLSHAIPNRVWAANKYYAIWRHDYGHVYGDDAVTTVDLSGNVVTPDTLQDTNFYVIDGDFVWICIDNNKGGISTDAPRLGTPDAWNIVKGDNDNYRWKKIARTATVDINNFSTFNYYPIKTPAPGDSNYTTQLALMSNAVNNAGAVFHIVYASGTGFPPNLTGTSGSGDTFNPGGGPVPYLTIEGDGTGFEAYIKTDGSGNLIGINIIDPGLNYTYANVKLNAPTGYSPAINKSHPIITSPNGLGADPVEDLCAKNVIVYMKFTSADLDFTSSNDYRRIGIVVNPIEYGTVDTVFTDLSGCAMTRLKLNNTTNVIKDNVIVDDVTGARGFVVDIDPDTVTYPNTIRIIRTRDENIEDHGGAVFNPGDTVTTNSETKTIQSGGVYPPAVNLNSGKIIYYENRRAISRAPDQEEELRIVFEF